MRPRRRFGAGLRPIQFLVSAYVGLPYVLFVISESVLNHNPRTSFVVLILAAALGGSFAVELLWAVVRAKQMLRADLALSSDREVRLSMVSQVVAFCAGLSSVVHAASGGGQIFEQVVGAVSSGPVVTLTSLLDGWKYIALALLVYVYASGQMSRRRLFVWVVFLIGSQAVVAYFTAITAPLGTYALFALLFCLSFGVIRPRVFLASILLALALWPVVFQVRNQIRSDGGVYVSSTTASERLRLDQQVASAADLEGPHDIGQPGPADIVRYGLVPRLFDANRPVLSTGTLINAYLGGAETSSYNFLGIGTLYFLYGGIFVPVHYALLAMVVQLLIWSRGGVGPVRLCVVALLLAGPAGLLSTFPDAWAAFLQSLVSLVPVALTIRILAAHGRRAALARTSLEQRVARVEMLLSPPSV